jgi:predicted Zn-dependent protease
MFNQPISFHLVNSKTLNAFTTGGVHVYVYNELFQKCETEDELAAVMSHEFAHIYCRHVQTGTQKQQIAAGAAMAAGAGGQLLGGSEHGSDYASLGTSLASAAGSLVVNGYTRKDEDQADEYGFQFYCRAGWDPQKFADFFKKMIELGYDTTPAVLSNHPTLASRVDATQKRVQEFMSQHGGTDPYRKPDNATPEQFQRYKAEAQQVAATTPNDQSLKQAQTLLAAFPSCVAPAETKDQQRAKQIVLESASKQQQ